MELRPPIRRGVYAAAGLALLLLKFNLDRLVLRSPSWSLTNYLYYLPGTLSLANTQAAPWMLALAVPFVAVGVWLTLGRLRDTGWHPALVGLFFVPFVNLLFFLALCLVPGRGQESGGEDWMERVLPDSRLGSAAIGVLLAVPAALILSMLLIYQLQLYALGLFVGVPFLCGFFAAWAYGARGRRGWVESAGIGALSVGVLGALLFGLVVEGAICLAMAAPIGLALGCLGGLMGQLVSSHDGRVVSAEVWLMALPLALAVEQVAAPKPEVRAVATVIEVDAPPERVWRNVVAFPELAPPSEWLFRTGIAYPIRARIEGRGVGAVRYCEFSTGAFVEPITVWDEPRLLRFGVTASPPPMHEWTPYGKMLSAPHLRGYFEAVEGEFRLDALAGGRTRIQGTTWYRHRIWPAAYWRLWSDAVVHRIHMRVLRHIRERSLGVTPS